MVKRYTSWDVVTDVGENIFVLEADYATLSEENRRLREVIEELDRYLNREFIYRAELIAIVRQKDKS